MIDPLLEEAYKKFRYTCLDIDEYINSVLGEYIALKSKRYLSDYFDNPYSISSFIVYDGTTCPYYYDGKLKGMISDIHFERIGDGKVQLKYNFKSSDDGLK